MYLPIYPHGSAVPHYPTLEEKHNPDPFKRFPTARGGEPEVAPGSKRLEVEWRAATMGSEGEWRAHGDGRARGGVHTTGKDGADSGLLVG